MIRLESLLHTLLHFSRYIYIYRLDVMNEYSSSPVRHPDSSTPRKHCGIVLRSMGALGKMP